MSSIQHLPESNPSYDQILTKVGWLNLVSDPQDPSSLKLVRAELKGSHLYIYKAPQVNARSFRIDPPTQTGPQLIPNTSSNGTWPQTLTPIISQQALFRSSQNTQSGPKSAPIQSSQSSTSGAPLTNSDSHQYPQLGDEDYDGETVRDDGSIISDIHKYPPPPKIYGGANTSSNGSSSAVGSGSRNGSIHSTTSLSKSNSRQSETSTSSNATPPILSNSSATPEPQQTGQQRQDLSDELAAAEAEAIRTRVAATLAWYDGSSSAYVLPLVPHFVPLLKELVRRVLLQSGEADEDEDDKDKEGKPSKTKPEDTEGEQLNTKKAHDPLLEEKVADILDAVNVQYPGLLVQQDVAPYLFKLVEMINKNKLREDMRQTQHKLLDLVSIDDLNTDNPLLELNSTVFMKDLSLFELASTILQIDLKFFSQWNAELDKSILLLKDRQPDFIYRKNPLIFNNDHHIHYLSRLVIQHLFIEQGSWEKKARLLEKWIDLGCLLDKLGDMSAWIGLASIILSQPLLRLTSLWSHISLDYINLLKNDWSPVLFELDRRYLKTEIDDGYRIMAPRGLGKLYSKENVIPYFGDLFVQKKDNLQELANVWKRIQYSFSRWDDYLSNITNHPEIIHYNDDVLRRYDAMGFIFSNESLNQVLFLGTTEDSTLTPSKFQQKLESIQSSPLGNVTPNLRNNEINANGLPSSKTLEGKLLRLLEVNCELVNLERIMKLSLSLDPDIPEGYLKPTATLPANGLAINDGSNYAAQGDFEAASNVNGKAANQSSAVFQTRFNHSSESVAESVTSLSTIPATPILSSSAPHGSSTAFSITNGSGVSSTSLLPGSTTPILNTPNTAGSTTSIMSSSFYDIKIPTFNNNYFTINLNKYDELSTSTAHPVLDPNTKFTNNISFKPDNFILDDASSNAGDTSEDIAVGGPELDDDDGLGIDVDDILNSEKFTNFCISDRPLSSGDHNSLQHATEKDIPKYATIDRLVDLLLIDSQYFGDDITVDLTEYRLVFLLNYNCFITTKELLNKLAHRFINSGNAVISLTKRNWLLSTSNDPNSVLENTEFPNWEPDPSMDVITLKEVDYKLLLRIQINILKTLIVLINNFYGFFSLELGNRAILVKLLKLFSNEILQWYNSNKLNGELEQLFESLVHFYKKLKKLYVKKTYRPLEISKFERHLLTEYQFNNSLHEVPVNRNLPGSKNITKIEKFIFKFNKMLTVFYKGIRTEEWFTVFKILESHFENNLLLEFNLQKPNVPEDKVIVLNIFNYFESLSNSADKALIVRRFPLVHRKLFHLYYKFKTYLTVQLLDPTIAPEERIDRMKTLLIMVKLSQLKMGEYLFVMEGLFSSKIPSYVESVVVNTIYSPESRTYAHLWIKAALDLNKDNHVPNFDSIESLLPRVIKTSDLHITDPLLPCFGWIIENLLAINRCPSFYNFAPNVINFNKRYLIFKIIKELGVEDTTTREFTPNDSKEFDFLLRLDESIVDAIPTCSKSDSSDKTRLFRGVIMEQYRILSVDNRKKYHGEVNVLVPITSGLSEKPSNPSFKRQSFSYKTNSSSTRFKFSGLFSKSRPFSINGSQQNTSSLSANKSVSVRELPHPGQFIEGRQKPFVVIALKNRKIFPVYMAPVSFKIDTDTSGENYLFQATNESDFNDWIARLTHANRHWFFSKSLTTKINPNHVTFGIPINVVCGREHLMTPNILVSTFEQIEHLGLSDIGIYRISCSLSELANLKNQIDLTGELDFVNGVYDVHALTSIVKSYLRELPTALITDRVIEELFSVKNAKDVDEERTNENYRAALEMLPAINYQTFKVLIKHLRKITTFSEVNKMTPSNIATVIGPALTEASTLDSLFNNFGLINSILERLIITYDAIFEDAEIATEPEISNESILDETDTTEESEDVEPNSNQIGDSEDDVAETGQESDDHQKLDLTASTNN